MTGLRVEGTQPGRLHRLPPPASLDEAVPFREARQCLPCPMGSGALGLGITVALLSAQEIPPQQGWFKGVELEVHMVTTFRGFHSASEPVNLASAALAASVILPAQQGNPCVVRNSDCHSLLRGPRTRALGTSPPHPHPHSGHPMAHFCYSSWLSLEGAQALPHGTCPWLSPFGGLQTEAGFVLKLRPQSSRPGGHLLPSLSPRLPPPSPPLWLPPSLPPREGLGRGQVGSPAAPGKGSFGFGCMCV